ncbi:hypothetical protein HDU79_008458 [Rhizoclosmatium sp. JEL0117]|nr:hypothetical protein HDU79_008458 [Rhizoclosmatium sp. JEL0117]
MRFLAITLLAALSINAAPVTTKTKHHGNTGHHEKTTLVVPPVHTTTAAHVVHPVTTAAVVHKPVTTAAAPVPTTTADAVVVPPSKPVGNACVISAYNGVSACASSKNILVKGPFTVPANQVLNFNLVAGAVVTVSGTITFAKGNLDTSNFLVTISGILYGNGQLYWDGKGGNGGVPKPKFVKVLTTGNSVISHLKIVNAPVHIFSVGGSDTIIDHITIDNSAGVSLGHNTDAFDVSATNVVVQNSVVHNQDDCLAVNHGTGIKFLNNICVGGHGISIGSVQSGSIVDNVHVQNCTIADSSNGVRIKTTYGATSGKVSNIVYEDITLSNISGMGIVVRQDYLNGGPKGVAVSKMPIAGLTLTNIHGTMKSGNSVFVLCAPGMCTDFTFTEINISPVKASCSGISPFPTGCQ